MDDVDELVDLPLDKVEAVLAPIDMIELYKRVDEIKSDVEDIQKVIAPDESESEVGD